MALNLATRWNRLVERVAQWTPIAKTITLLDSLSPRDRKLLLFMISCIASMIVATGWMFANKELRHMEQEISRKEQQLQIVQEVSRSYDSLKRQIEHIENELGKNSSFNLTSFLEEEAIKQGMGDAISISSKGNTANEGFVEMTVGVSMRKRSLVEVVQYLYAIETAPQRLTVKRLRIKTAYRSKAELNVDLEVSVLTPQEA